ncbi:MAG: ATP-dependent Clp protease adaptor ClpS [Planctomycetota bacterium]
MSLTVDESKDVRPIAAAEEDDSSTAVAEPPAETEPKTKPASKKSPKRRPKRPGQLPPYRVLLHNDDVNTVEAVVLTVLELTPLTEMAAIRVTLEAHKRGLSLLLVTHKERAELYVEQFKSKLLKVTIEPAE